MWSDGPDDKWSKLSYDNNATNERVVKEEEGSDYTRCVRIIAYFLMLETKSKRMEEENVYVAAKNDFH